MKNLMARKARYTLLLNVSFLIFFAASAFCGTQHEVHFKDTDYELNIYRIYGAEKGKTLMIIGGIQGDEPGGYLSADLYADMALQKGNLIVVPRANFFSIIEHKRAINRDMNRRFVPANSDEYYEDKIVEILKGLMARSDYLLNLHEGSGFFRETWESDLENPARFGQSIIADAEYYHAKLKGTTVSLGETARKVAERVNRMIDNRQYHFRFNNHRTFEKDTTHAEQRKSATYFALSTYEIPAFGIETSKEIKDIEAKVRMQTMVINSFMEEFGIVPENPKVAMEPPKLKYLVLTINDSQSAIVRDKGEVNVKKGDRISISQIEANYERGLSVDIAGIGTANDYNKEFVINAPAKAIVRKDGFIFGMINISLSDLHDTGNGIKDGPQTAVKLPIFKYLIATVNDVRKVISGGEHLKVVKGDRIKIIDVISEGVNADDLVVNFLGFVGNKINNTGEDRGYSINTAKDLWLKYSKDGKGIQYSIAINNKDSRIGDVTVDIEEPRMHYIVVKHGQGGQKWYADGETIYIAPRETLEIVDVKTNINGNVGVKVNVSGNEMGGENKIITFKDHIKKDDEIVITREGMIIGKTRIRTAG